MKIVLTGASGAIGPAVITELEQSHALLLFSRRKLDSPHPQVVGDLVSAQDCLQAVEGADAVIHLAAYSEPNPAGFRFNTLSTFALLEAARQSGVSRFIFASTNCVYGHCYRVTKRPYPVEFLPFDEDHPRLPESDYGISKIACEQIVQTYSQTWGIRSASLRLNWVWRRKEVDWRKEMERFDLERYAGSFWAYVEARDCATGFRLAVEAPGLPLHGAYNISAADQMAEEDSAALIERFYPDVQLTRPVAGRESLFAWQRAQDAFGYTPQFSWMEG